MNKKNRIVLEILFFGLYQWIQKKIKKRTSYGQNSYKFFKAWAPHGEVALANFCSCGEKRESATRYTRSVFGSLPIVTSVQYIWNKMKWNISLLPQKHLLIQRSWWNRWHCHIPSLKNTKTNNKKPKLVNIKIQNLQWYSFTMILFSICIVSKVFRNWVVIFFKEVDF